jgi:hypothetical protein
MFQSLIAMGFSEIEVGFPRRIPTSTSSARSSTREKQSADSTTRPRLESTIIGWSFDTTMWDSGQSPPNLVPMTSNWTVRMSSVFLAALLAVRPVRSDQEQRTS